MTYEFFIEPTAQRLSELITAKKIAKVWHLL
jgi:hypothetical protein